VLKLLIGTKSYSSWSLRPWLLLKQAGIPFQEEVFSFNDPTWKARVQQTTPAGKVPALVDGDLVVWDSLAIAEYVAEKFPDKRLWPENPAARAMARSMCAEMHAGFATLRRSMPMNFTAEFPGRGWNLEVQRDIDRIVAMWAEAQRRHADGGPFLFGRFTIPDAYFAPVVRRFVGHAVELPPTQRSYVDTIASLPAYQAWAGAARAENDFFQDDEPYRTNPAAGGRA
jgi:glutathione S-transferase